jgi:CheY-like chemotaxis protein
LKVLIVDDAPANLRLLRAVLEGESLEVVEAPDGVQALLSVTYVLNLHPFALNPRISG